MHRLYISVSLRVLISQLSNIEIVRNNSREITPAVSLYTLITSSKDNVGYFTETFQFDNVDIEFFSYDKYNITIAIHDKENSALKHALHNVWAKL